MSKHSPGWWHEPTRCFRFHLSIIKSVFIIIKRSQFFSTFNSLINFSFHNKDHVLILAIKITNFQKRSEYISLWFNWRSITIKKPKSIFRYEKLKYIKGVALGNRSQYQKSVTNFKSLLSEFCSICSLVPRRDWKTRKWDPSLKHIRINGFSSSAQSCSKKLQTWAPTLFCQEP